jgi:glycosyltransferase involved in cell wall biosynthesis
MAGLSRLAIRLYEALAKDGFDNLRNTIDVYEGSLAHSSSLVPLLTSRQTYPLEKIDPVSARSIDNIAVHAHIFYAELAPEIRQYLENIPALFNLYVTTDTEDKAAKIKSSLDGMGNVRELDIRVVPNRGRDIGPMLVELGTTLAHHEVVLHIHTKRSPHNPDLRGWRRYLMQSLLGSPQIVAAILDRFARDEQLGILYPQIYHPVIPFMRIGGNAEGISSLLRRAGRDAEELGKLDMTAFPAGFMLWFRGSAIMPFIRMKLGLEDFDAEAGQDDSTLAHAIERIFPYMAAIGGFRSQAYLPVRMLDPAQPGAVPLTQLLSVLPTSSTGICMIFDHKTVEGVNRYTIDLINENIKNGRAVLRMYHSNGAWLVEWIAADDGLIFVEASTENLFAVLSKVGVDSIIVNSLYMYPEIEQVIRHIVNLTKSTASMLDYKVHDYYAICPSQHLLGSIDQYCFVPQDIHACNTCLRNNSHVHWVGINPDDIVKWREPFVQLLVAATTISVFEASSIEIMKRAFQVDETKIRVEPRNQIFFKHVEPISLVGSLHIGVVGTLTVAKGSSVINKLAEHIEAHNLQVPISILGSSNVPIAESIRVLGTYNHDELPHIVQRECINVILITAIIPETFSYTISEAMQMGLPIVAFDIGAQGARVKQYKLGKVVPLNSSPEVILEAIQSVLITAKG